MANWSAYILGRLSQGMHYYCSAKYEEEMSQTKRLQGSVGSLILKNSMHCLSSRNHKLWALPSKTGGSRRERLKETDGKPVSTRNRQIGLIRNAVQIDSIFCRTLNLSLLGMMGK